MLFRNFPAQEKHSVVDQYWEAAFQRLVDTVNQYCKYGGN